MANDTELSSYLQYLPAIFSEDPFLGRFLLAFEQVLSGLPDVDEEPRVGLEQTIAGLATLFDPKETREEFLPWLAGWVALSLRADWTLEQQRGFLADIVPLYRSRGTRDNLIKLLRIYTGGTPTIDEGAIDTFQIGVRSTIGKDTIIGEPPPHFFRVRVTLENLKPDPAERKRQEHVARAVIDLQKPAHTAYELAISSDTMKIGERSRIGKDTLIGRRAVENGKEVF
jgi:phage tail-like protein